MIRFTNKSSAKRGRDRCAYKGGRRIIAYLLVTAMLLGNLAGGIQADAAHSTEKADAGASSEQKNEVTIGGEEYQVILRQQNAWENGCQAEIEVKNTGREKLKNWSIHMELAEGTVSHAWNVTSRKHGNMWHMDSQAHNRVIAPGASAVFGCQLGGASRVKAKSLELLQKDRTTRDKKEYAVTYRIVNEWDAHAKIEAEIRNQSGQDIVDWQLDFELGGEITDIWNAEVLSHAGNRYQLGNKDYNAVIPAGGSIKIGFVADYGREAVRQPEGGNSAVSRVRG